ncbi:MAG: molybdenum cofactor guanylyltransferase [Methylococcaceae bacterium]|nr:molybdenum cofactor guanylyltransferase [Methylococcaceae bacterium]
MNTQTKVTGVILAGGRARRMNHQDKGLLKYRGRPMVSYGIEALAEVCNQVIINANRNIDQYQQFGLPVVVDQTDTFDGPLAGVFTAMIFAETGKLLVVPCDSPLIESTHLNKLLTVLNENDADIAVAFDGKRLHPVFLALKTELKSSLQHYLASGQTKVDTWLKQQKLAIADFSAVPEVFINLNSLTELSALEAGK